VQTRKVQQQELQKRMQFWSSFSTPPEGQAAAAAVSTNPYAYCSSSDNSSDHCSDASEYEMSSSSIGGSGSDDEGGSGSEQWAGGGLYQLQRTLWRSRSNAKEHPNGHGEQQQGTMAAGSSRAAAAGSASRRRRRELPATVGDDGVVRVEGMVRTANAAAVHFVASILWLA
jgi:hypothetical protein